MKVKELIQKLQKLNPDALVLTRGYEDGFDKANDNGPFEEIVYERKETVRSWYNGQYDKIIILDLF